MKNLKVGDIVQIKRECDGYIYEVVITFINYKTGFLVRLVEENNVRCVYLFSEFDRGKYKLIEEVISLENI